jgi:antitoxin component of RelBE/YafQ-DinJ toxin-antitoxin module
MIDRITFRLGSLIKPLSAYCEKHGTTPSDAIRLALSRLLRVEAPEMLPGNPDIGEQAEVGAAARWKQNKKRR